MFDRTNENDSYEGYGLGKLFTGDKLDLGLGRVVGKIVASTIRMSDTLNPTLHRIANKFEI